MSSPLDHRAVGIARSAATTRHFLTTVALLFVLSNAPLQAHAQNDAPRSYVAQVTGLITELDEKSVFEALSGWEALERIDLSRAAHRLKFATTQPVSDGELAARLAGTGTGVFWLAEVQANGSLSGASYEANAFPVFEDTGDPVADNARYDADKAAWLSAHPGWVDENTRPDEHTGTETDAVK